MASKKTPAKPEKKPQAQTPAKPKLENLAARPSYDDMLDEQLVDHSGVFRVTSALSQAQAGHGEEPKRFPNDSLAMAAQRDGFRDDGPTIDEAVVEETTVDDEALQALKRQRITTLAARAQQQNRPRNRR